MATLFVVTNPTKKIGPNGTEWKCVKCGSVVFDYDEARECARADWRRLGRDPDERREV